ncbi:N-formylglutamate amidohydrolase [Propionivibrio soli]|uniref:N-formylglutamate amidohydrolase n=1 Tax=Propionivibrio soli TaxID=2976531 RepID=UPI0021E74D33|nr:N-formylglutamate amidohydrolase [Propionivibrio soli]
MPTTGRPSRFLVTCEHGGNRVPAPYRALFASHQALLRSHRGYDPGALRLARELAASLGAPTVLATTSRLLIDLNRSPGHPRLYSEVTRPLPLAAREEIMARYYLPYRQRVERQVGTLLEQGFRVVHLSSHSFTPVLDEQERNADVGFLYDPTRETERVFCLHWIAALRQRLPDIRLRRNYPYAGRSDGLCTWLRRRHPGNLYLGVELEVNQRHATAGGTPWQTLRRSIVSALVEAAEMLDAHEVGLNGHPHAAA